VIPEIWLVWKKNMAGVEEMVISGQRRNASSHSPFAHEPRTIPASYRYRGIADGRDAGRFIQNEQARSMTRLLGGPSTLESLQAGRLARASE
jgi:hypothetical protein